MGALSRRPIAVPVSQAPTVPRMMLVVAAAAPRCAVRRSRRMPPSTSRTAGFRMSRWPPAIRWATAIDDTLRVSVAGAEVVACVARWTPTTAGAAGRALSQCARHQPSKAAQSVL